MFFVQYRDAPLDCGGEVLVGLKRRSKKDLGCSRRTRKSINCRPFASPPPPPLSEIDIGAFSAILIEENAGRIACFGLFFAGELSHKQWALSSYLP